MVRSLAILQAEAEARERHWQSEVHGLQSKVEKLEGLLQREMGHHQINSPTPRPVYDLSPVGLGQFPELFCKYAAVSPNTFVICSCNSVWLCNTALTTQYFIVLLTVDASQSAQTCSNFACMPNPYCITLDLQLCLSWAPRLP